MSKKKPPVTDAERLAVVCPKCRAPAGEKCHDYRGKVKSWCVERARPDITERKRAKKAQQINDKHLATMGGDNSLLTFAAGGADSLMESEGFIKETAATVGARKEWFERRFLGENGGTAEWALVNGFNWIKLHYIRRETAKLLGDDAERRLWDYFFRVYRTNLDYICDSYCEALTTRHEWDLALIVREEQGQPTTYNKSGIIRRLIPTDSWPPLLYCPPLTRDQFRARFGRTYSLVTGVTPLDVPEPDDGGLFAATIGRLPQAG